MPLQDSRYSTASQTRKRMNPAPNFHSNTISLLSKVTARSATVTSFVLLAHLSNLSFYWHFFTPVPYDSGQGRCFHIQNMPSRSRPFLWSHDPTRPIDYSYKCMLISPAWSRFLGILAFLGTESRGRQYPAVPANQNFLIPFSNNMVLNFSLRFRIP